MVKLFDEDTRRIMIDSIQKNLPQAVGETLKEELEELARFRKNSEVTVKLTADLSEVRKELATLKRQTDNLWEREQTLVKKEDEIACRERDFAMKQLQAQLEREREKTQFCKDIALGLVRNVEYRNEVFTSSNKTHMVNGYPQSMCESDNTTETKKAT